ncbi:uncharacterized protein LOC121736777 [Aricia agestis]|uniref:uncharacterized protein LOC121736773 n=1 Tax=Aricia agestis TaxID=91739 RepID=UPI001C208CDE|nr:uncharacterized protein LOC121736773 [Aricia agestis]XP_041984094.1 uncharacterized protein LOC121736777 [Aricia agestis]
MESQHAKNTPRVGTGNGESHTPASAGDRARYTGGPKHAMEKVRSGSNDDLSKKTASDRHDVMVMLTASEGEGSRATTPVSTGSATGFFRRHPGPGSGTDDMSGDETAASLDKDSDDSKRARFLRKRRGGEDSPEKDKGAAKNRSSSKRGRGRPPTTGEYAGLAKAKQDFLDVEQRALEVEAERQILESAKRIPLVPRVLVDRMSESSFNLDVTMAEKEEVTTARLGSVITTSLEVISDVAKKSKNLKGTSVAALKQATSAIQEACVALLNHSASTETRALEMANARLSRELEEVKKELETVKRRLADAPPQPAPINQELNIEELLQRAVREAVSVTSARMDARLEGLEARLLPEPRLRPPLAADNKRKDKAGPAITLEGPPPIEKRTPSPEPTVSTLMPPTNPGPAPKKAKKKKKTTAAAVEAAAARRDAAATTAAPQPASTSEWTRVVKTGKVTNKKEEEKSQKKGKRKRHRRKQKLRAPKSAAVVITLMPDAEKRGVSYKDVLERAKQRLDLPALEIPAVKFKQAVTGARLYEVSGTACQEKADALAGKLREILGEDDVRISRPQKCAELRVSGMDDTATPTEIAAAIARPGNCRVEDVKVGEIRLDRSGRGTAWVKCPVEAAKLVTAPGTKVYVGWLVVRVTLLAARTMRCYRCLETGHTRATCPSETDLSKLCFRCGQSGHQTGTCGNPPHCALCASKGKPADHIVGSKPCSKSAPTKKRSGSKKSQETKELATTATAASGARESNLNHCAQAQDLWVQAILERRVDVAVVAEPYRVLARDDWIGDVDSSVAVVLGSNIVPPSSGNTTRGQGFVVVGLRALTVVGVYFSPNRPLAEFEALLLRLTAYIEGSSPPVVVAGDFNAKSTLWGSPATNARGRVVEDWLITTGLVVANRGAVSTCVRRQGESIVDLTLVSSSIARRVSDWQVLGNTETLSDHLYISFAVCTHSVEQGRPTPSGGGPRWSLKGLDRDLLEEAAIVASWAPLPSEDVEECAEWLNEAAHNICDASMPRVGPAKPRCQSYWWCPELTRLRQECVAARRCYQRYRRRRTREEQIEESVYDQYRTARRELRDAIKEAKKRAWEEFLDTLDQDPWGKPYKWVRQKLRPAAPPLTQTLQPELRRTIISALFPSRAEWSPPPMAPPTAESDDDEEVPPVSAGELAAAVQKMGQKNRAPGLDGVPGRVWVLSVKHMEERVLTVLTRCLVQGRVPRRWKTGKLVLLRKHGRPEDQPSAYRPIVLIDEICKTFERVIVARLNRHLENVGPNLSSAQFGFRPRRSTIDAVARIRAITEEVVSRGGVVVVVSLDISNAFNTLPWATINEALRYHGVPRYMRRVIRNYLSERSVQYPTEDGNWEEHEVDCGVPQGSSLGPTLWDIGFDYVLRGADLPGAEKVAYADDTAVVCRGKTVREAVILATAAVAQTVRRIESLGLKVALHKSEALIFHGPRNAPPPGLAIVVGGTRIEVASSMTYLGLVLDSRWSFKEHFRRLSEKVTKSAGALATLLPNLGGPSLECRRLYMGVIRSMCMYGAPIWAEDLLPANGLVLGRLQRVMATRAVRGYRTISKDAACLLAGSVPWDIDARALADIYWRCAEVRAGGSNPLPDAVRRWRAQAKDRTLELWEERLLEPRVSVDLVEAIRPVLKDWVKRKHGALSFHLTQVLTGHGCFGRYLCEIARREESARCHHCTADRDTADHTILACPSWTRQRAALTAAIGPDLSLPALVQAMLSSEHHWRDVERFAEEVISIKEEAERVREREALDPHRRRRPRRRRIVQNGRNVPP